MTMEPFRLHILGCGSAKPSNGHLPSCQVLDLRGKLYMIDCGEGAQMQWSRVGLGMTRLGHIFISHSHGDHCFGLPGLISTMGLLGRTAALHLPCVIGCPVRVISSVRNLSYLIFVPRCLKPIIFR